MKLDDRRRGILGGAVSGALWGLMLYGLSLDFDIGWPITVGSGVLTGIGVSIVYYSRMLSISTVWFWLLPLLTLPTAIIIFATLNWLAVTIFLDLNAPSLMEFVLGYLAGGMLSIFTPIFFVLAITNQLAIHALLERAV